MADYYPLIARAVAGLEKNSGDARRAVYERARAALVAQLRSVTPALNESDVTRERLALEEAIRKVEAESARQSPNRAEVASRLKVPQLPDQEEPEREPEAAPEPPPRRTPMLPRADGRAVSAAARKISELRDEDAGDGSPSTAESEPLKPPRKAPLSPRSEGWQAAQAAPARKPSEPRYADPRPEAPPVTAPKEAPRNMGRPRPVERTAGDRTERQSAERRSPEGQPSQPPAGERQSGDRGSVLNSGLRDFREVVSEANELGGASARASRSARESLAAGPTRVPESNRSAPRIPESQENSLSLDDIAEPVMLEPSFIVDESRPLPPRQRQAPPSDIPVESPPRRSIIDVLKIAVAVLIVGGFGLGVIWEWPNLTGLYHMLWSPAAEQAQEPPPTAVRPKIAERFDPSVPPAQPPDAAAVAQRVVLYEEDPNDPQGKRSVGSVVWRTDAISPGPGKAPELAVRGDVEIPERGMSMTWTLRRDTDQNRSTSHTIEIMFKLPPDFPSGGILNVPGIWMKEAEQSQGTALAGLAVKVTTGYFLIGLSAAPADRDRNVQLLKERPWFDIPIVYTNNRRAILAMEKGTPGERAFQQAFAAWEK